MFAKKLLVLSIVVTLSVAQQPDVQQVNQNDDSSTPSTFVDLILCPFQNEPIKCAGRYAGRMLNGFSKQLTEARKNILECGVKYTDLQYLNQTDIGEMFPGRQNVGLRARLRENLFYWKKEQSVREILQSSDMGRKILQNYENNGILDEKSREDIISCIVEYFFDPILKKYKVPDPKMMNKLAQDIVNIFPNESIDIYYIPRNKTRNPSGRLFNRFIRLNRKSKSTIDERNMKKHKSNGIDIIIAPQEIPPNAEDKHDNDEMEILKNKIQLVSEKDNSARDIWARSYHLRTTEILNNTTSLTKILNDWPYFKSSIGDTFIDYDFGIQFQKSKLSLFQKWDRLVCDLRPIFLERLKDKHYKQLYNDIMLNKYDKVEADRDVEKNLQARGYSVSDFRGQKPSAIMKVIENSVEGVTALVGDAIAEILAPEKSLEKQDTDIGDLIEDDDGSDEGTEFDHGRENGELRGKKKKKKKALMKLLILGAVLKAKIELILKLIATKLQIKFLIIAGIGLLINVARFWIDLKKKHEPQKVIYYEHAQHQHHYEDDDKWGGYWKRSLDVLNKPVAVKNGNIVDYFDVNEGVIDTRSHSNYRNSDYDSHSLAYKNHRPY